MPITDVQWVLGHAHLSTTQIYVTPAPDDVVQSVLAHHRRQRDGQAALPPAGRAGGPAACPCGGLPAGDAGRAVRQAAVTAGTGISPRQRVRGPLRPRMRADVDAELRERFPPRAVPDQWEATGQDRDTVMSRLLREPFTTGTTYSSVNRRRRGLARFLDWVSQYPGDTWQQRWLTSGVAGDGRLDWRPQAARWLTVTGREPPQTAGLEASVTSGLGQLIYADVLRPGLEWLLASPIRFPLGGEMPRVRDPAGFAALEERAAAAGIGFFSRRRAIEQVAIILAAKGGPVADITVGDCLEFLQIRDRLAGTLDSGKGAGFYQLLHSAGIFPAGAPATLRMLDPRFQGQLTDAELIDQYAIACQPVRDLLVAYLGERRPSLDYAILKTLAYLLGKLFWKDIETHNPGISSLRMQPDTAAAWKLRLAVKTVPGSGGTATAVRMDTQSCLAAVRAFYLDIAQWALDDPARWGPWAAPYPVRREDVSTAKQEARRKSRMDQRTRERLPVLPALAAAAARNREAAAALLAAAAVAEPGSLFTSGTVTLRRRVTKTPASRVWAEDPGTGRRHDLTLEEEAAFWAWAAIEVLRATGMRRSELAGLCWPDVDLASRRIHIRQAQVDDELDSTKSADSERIISMDKDRAETLRTWRKAQLAERLAWAGEWTDSGRVFTREDGTPLRPAWISIRFDTLAARAGLPPITLHGLRHGAATMLLAAGQPPKVVSETWATARSRSPWTSTPK